MTEGLFLEGGSGVLLGDWCWTGCALMHPNHLCAMIPWKAGGTSQNCWMKRIEPKKCVGGPSKGMGCIYNLMLLCRMNSINNHLHSRAFLVGQYFFLIVRKVKAFHINSPIPADSCPLSMGQRSFH